MNLHPDRLAAAVKKTLAPVYLIAGAEPLIVEECRDAVLAAAQGQGFDQRDVFHVDARFDWGQLDALSIEQSLFASRKIIDIRLPTGKPGREGGAWFTGWAAQPDPDRLLVVSCAAWDASSRKAKWSASLAAAGALVEIWPVRPEQLPQWVGARLRSRGLVADDEAVGLLSDHVEGNLLAARQEIEKLALLYPDGSVTVDRVRDAVSNNARFDAFRLGECLFGGRTAEALRVAAGLNRTGVAIQAVVGALNYQLTQFQAVRADVAGGLSEAQAFGRHRVFRNQQPLMRQALRGIDAVRLGRALRSLSLIDRQSKGQAGGDAWQTLDSTIADLGRAPSRRTA